MRFLAALAFLGAAGLAQAQYCATLPIPQAPDMRGPGLYYWNCQGYLYGPVHYVRPPFPPFQGMLPGPPNPKTGGGGGPAWQAAHQTYAKHGMQPGYMAYQPQQQHPGGYPGLWFHPNVRSPRDFFMTSDNGLTSEPYRYNGVPTDR